MSDKINIQNRKGEKVVVLLEIKKPSQGLAFIMHGLGGFKEQPHIQVMNNMFQKHGYTTVLFDTTNTFGESDGLYEDATTTNYYEDLEDVINWSKNQSWYHKPFCLAGHSLGAICIALYAQNHAAEVKALAPISTVVSGELTLEAPKTKLTLDNWKKTGWKEEMSSDGKRFKRLPWSHIEDRLKYTLLPKVNNLTMPVLMIVGDQDDLTPPEHQKILFEKLPGKKELHILENSPHTFKTEDDLKKIEVIFDQWIQKL